MQKSRRDRDENGRELWMLARIETRIKGDPVPIGWHRVGDAPVSPVPGPVRPDLPWSLHPLSSPFSPPTVPRFPLLVHHYLPIAPNGTSGVPSPARLKHVPMNFTRETGSIQLQPLMTENEIQLFIPYGTIPQEDVYPYVGRYFIR